MALSCLIALILFFCDLLYIRLACLSDRIDKNRLSQPQSMNNDTYFFAAFKGNPVPTVILDFSPSGFIITHANNAYCELAGLHENELLGKCPTEVLQEITFEMSADDITRLSASMLGATVNRNTDKVMLHTKTKAGIDAQIEIQNNVLDIPGMSKSLCIQTCFVINHPVKSKHDIHSLVKHKLVIDHSPSAIFLSRPDGTILEANKAACELFGYSEQELRQIGRLGIIDHDEEVAQEKLKERREKGRARGEVTGIKKGGVRFPVEFSSVIFSDDEGQQIASTTMHDITERKKVEDQLRKSEQRFKSLVQDGADLIGILDLSGNYSYVSPTSITVLGMLPEEFIGKNAFTFIHEDDLESVMSNFSRLATEKRINIGPFRFRHKNGNWRWIETTVVNLSDDPAVNGIVANSRDVSEKIESFKALHESNERYRLVTKATLDAIWDWDLLTDTIFWGEGFRTMFGFALQEMGVDGASWINQIHPEDAERVADGINSVIQGNEDKWSDEYRYRNGRGEYVFVFDRGIVLRDTEGKAIRMVGSMRDISQYKHEDVQKTLLAEVSQLFTNQASDLHRICKQVATSIRKFTNDQLVEIWLLNPDKKKLSLFAMVSEDAAIQRFYDETPGIKTFIKGEGLPGVVWEKGLVQKWKDPAQHEKFVRGGAAQLIGLNEVLGIPLIYGEQFIGVLVLGSIKNGDVEISVQPLFDGFADRLAAEIRRKQLENELSQIFNTCPDIMCIAGPDGYFTKVNPAFCELLEYTDEELTNRPFTDFIYKEDQDATHVEYTETVGGSRKAQGFVNRYVTKSGSLKWISWNSSPFFGEESHSFAYGRDITETKELQDLLDAANKLARIGGWEVNLETNTVLFSDITREIHEVDKDYIPSLKDGINFYKEDVRHEVEQYIDVAIREGKSWNFELPIITAKGNERWIRSIGKGEYKDGKCIRLYGSFQDIHAQKSAEENSLRVFKEKNAILESISDAFIAVDNNWIITYWNKEAETILGRPKTEVLGKNLWDVYADAIDSIFYQKYHTAMQEGIAVHFEARYDTLDMWVEISAYPSVGGLSVYFKNVTDRKRTEQQVQKMYSEMAAQAKQLAASNAELEQFAYVASHDLQEPLRMVSSFLTQLEKNYKEKLDDRAKQYIYFAVDGAQRMRQIILDLLEYSRVGRLKMDKERIDLNDIVNELLSLYRTQIDEIKAEVSVDQLPNIYGYKAPVRQVFHNIFSNALKYYNKTAKTDISIGVREEDKHWVFSIADNGIGIKKDYHDKIFVIFQRLHAKDEYPGTGMGLTICKKIIENMGGKIWVEAEEGKGSTFYFTILKDLEV